MSENDGSQIMVKDELDRLRPICGWFAKCTNPSNALVDHPVLGTVFICDRCAAKTGQQVIPCRFELHQGDTPDEVIVSYHVD